MKVFLTIFIFSVVLFLYLHIQYHLKTSNDLEVYTIESPTKDKLEEICDIRQPVVFRLDLKNVTENCTLEMLEENYGAFDFKVRDINNRDKDDELYLPVVCKDAVTLFKNNKERLFITENNSDFLKETGVYKYFMYNDSFLRPHMVSKCKYDFISGSKYATTPLRYKNNYRSFFYVTKGSVSLKLIPPQYEKYLNVQKDYENGEYYSPINPWNIEQQYKADFGKVKTLDITLTENELLFIPAYWFYSIKYNDISSVCVFEYRTYMNTVAISPTLLLEFLQQQNVKHKVFSSLNNKLIMSPN